MLNRHHCRPLTEMGVYLARLMSPRCHSHPTLKSGGRGGVAYLNLQMGVYFALTGICNIPVEVTSCSKKPSLTRLAFRNNISHQKNLEKTLQFCPQQTSSKNLHLTAPVRCRWNLTFVVFAHIAMLAIRLFIGNHFRRAWGARGFSLMIYRPECCDLSTRSVPSRPVPSVLSCPKTASMRPSRGIWKRRVDGRATASMRPSCGMAAVVLWMPSGLPQSPVAYQWLTSGLPVAYPVAYLVFHLFSH